MRRSSLLISRAQGLPEAAPPALAAEQSGKWCLGIGRHLMTTMSRSNGAATARSSGARRSHCQVPLSGAGSVAEVEANRFCRVSRRVRGVVEHVGHGGGLAGRSCCGRR